MPRAVIAWRSKQDPAQTPTTSALADDVEHGQAVRSQAGTNNFRPHYRLRKTDEYSSVFAFRKAIRGKYFMLHFRSGGGVHPRLGVVVAKKLARRAVQRNLVKRLGREIFRNKRASLPPYDLILRLSAPLLGVKRQDIRQDIVSLLGRLK